MKEDAMARISTTPHHFPVSHLSPLGESTKQTRQSAAQSTPTSPEERENLARREFIRRARLKYFMRNTPSIPDDKLDTLLEKRRTETADELNALKRPENSAPLYSKEMDAAIGYLLRCAVDRSPIDSTEVEKEYYPLQRTLQEVRSLLKRGNVTTDIDETNHESTWRARAARRLILEIRKHATGTDFRASAASSAALLGAGNCGENAYLLLALHGECLQPGQTHELVICKKIDHSFTIFRAIEALIGDPWAEGPVVKSEHSYFFTSPDDISTHATVDHISGPQLSNKAWQRYQKMKADTNLGRKIEEILEVFKTQELKEKNPWAPTSVLSQEFLDRTSRRMMKHESMDNAAPVGLQNQIHAAGVWRNLGAGVAFSAEYAPYMIEEAKKMDPKPK